MLGGPINYHTRTMPFSDPMYSEDRSELGGWPALGVVDMLRRFTDLVATWSMAGTEAGCQPTAMHHRAVHEDRRERIETAGGAKGVAGMTAAPGGPEEARMSLKPVVGPALEHHAAVPDRRSVDVALAQGKWFVSIIASLAAVLGLPATSSGIDWKSASQGLDLVLNASREYITGQETRHNQHADHDAYFERSAYINGTQHILRGLPRDLDPAEAAMLHRSMPRALSASCNPPPAAAAGGWGWSGGRARRGGRRRSSRGKLQGLAMFCMYAVYSIAMWATPKLAGFGTRLVEAEQRHQYVPRLLMALAALLQVVVLALHWLSGCWPCQALLMLLNYALDCVRGVVFDFSVHAHEHEHEHEAVREGVVPGWGEEDAVKTGI
ncbi:hypothetical protein MYCTH_2124224 [Thermothelomyces thermophilus ATCC 42464]|uniref:Uncharacterized protein n=1 Tax=Thermothelomyces thermophilus (strain ATCC 42464 / BCRC 31852 / DSM 1799) TaxID=573729 RepID=G2Q3Y4_THET4|nr:uncharacterized protein MYCTH_2124224 [Thermothelomyces thermophilus ATCC 42464]AEO55287.1 hypothetical protein MYCTH_2124224 [Thermothelomyces thermophilus ATCC 42464]